MNALLALLIIAYVVLAAFIKFPSWVEPMPPKETTARTAPAPETPTTDGRRRLPTQEREIRSP